MSRPSRKLKPARVSGPAREFAEEAERYRTLVELQGDYLSLARADGELVYANAAYSRLYGVPLDEIVGRNLFDFVPAEQRDVVRLRIAAALAEGKSVPSKNQVRTPKGEVRWVAWSNLGYRGPGGEPMIHSVGRDIQAQIEAETRLRESEARFRLLAEASLDVIIALDRNLIRTYVSPACREVFGVEPETLIGEPTGNAAHPDDTEGLNAGLRSLLAGRQERFVSVNRRGVADGRWIWTETSYRAVRDPLSGEVSGIVGSSRDVTTRKEAEEQLARDYQRLEALAGQDGLTGLANRRAFDEAMQKALLRAEPRDEPLTLLMLDVDRFKAFNDYYGHLAGDDALRAVARAIKSCLRRIEDLPVRYGGEEFAVLCPGRPLEEGGQIAQDIRRAVRDLAIRHAGSEYGIVTVSIGVAATRATSPGDHARLVSCADAALYEAKRAGRDRARLAPLP